MGESGRLMVLQNGEWRHHRYEGVFGNEPRWLAVAPADRPIELMISLLECVAPPMRIELEVLEDEGLDAEIGDVFEAASALSRADAESWLRGHAEILESDARLVAILHGAQGERIVYDEHNRLLLNGPAPEFEQLLLAAGLLPGDPSIPMPHSHHYREDLAPALAEMLGPRP